MDKIRLDFFDVLGYLIPGTALLMALWVTADNDVQELSNLYLFISKIKGETLLSCIVIAYIIGFTLHFFGSLFNRMLNSETAMRLFGKKICVYMSITERKIKTKDMPFKWVLIREHGEKHLGILDRWQALKALSGNMAAFSLIAVGLCLLKWGFTGKDVWGYIAPAFFVLFLLYTKQANVFRSYLDDDSIAVIKGLGLERESLPAAQPKA